MSLITCNSLVLGYDSRRVVEDLTFSVNEGDYLVIVGENGSGKSTLIKTLLELNKPISGSIEYSDGLKKNEIGYLPQQTATQKDFPASVFEVVLSGCLNRSGLFPFYTKAQKDTARKNMELLGISHLEKCCYRSLSGGQQQRVLLARALCATERVLLLDEPTNALDPNMTEEFYRLIKKINDGGITVITVSHDGEAIRHASHILHIARRPKYFGTLDGYRKSEVGSAFLGGGEPNA